MAYLQSFRSSFPLVDYDPNMEIMNQFAELHSTNMNFQSLIPLSCDDFFTHQPPHQFSENLPENFPAIFFQNPQPANYESNKRKAVLDVSEISSGNSSSPSLLVSDRGINRAKSSGRGKRVKINDKEEEKPKEVVHVRARRGQATDSHSLAERVRRGKINERLKCLQDIVPGCYKTMGMAMMLDEIINYVQSLQNQVEFLSMKLTAASTFYDFNSDTDDFETMQERHTRLENWRAADDKHKAGYGGIHSTWPL